MTWKILYKVLKQMEKLEITPRAAIKTIYSIIIADEKKGMN